ncbi:class I histocompatibility antigen, F10 alpha chain-like isoform X2 [Sardina pilchardus]|uniref:class I histocompatibility antigen, F10 alpha chain-like isoform X2 n=1 Tax=Sardina pilchardus TaxID=27697 RepID=UPI002E0FD796
MGLIAVVLLVGVILPSLNAQTELSKSDIERHSLYYVYTALSKPVSAPGIFEFTGMGVLDNRKIDYYNSVDQMKIPEQDWMKAKLPADYWEKGTQSRRSKEQWFKVNVNILMERMRQNNSDVHVLNWRHGCEVDKYPDGTVKFIKGADQYSYDGKDFLSFDDASMQWIAPVTEAVPTKQKWDGVPILNQYTKGYLEKECVDWLGKFVTYADAELKGSSPPEIFLFARTSKESADKLTMTCLATGFLPKDIQMSIQKRGSIVAEVDPLQIFPNGDGTHQTRLVVHVLKSEANAYQCSVMHRTLRTPVVSNWETDGVVTDEPSSIGGIVGGAAGGAVVLLVVIVVAVVMIKKKGGKQTIERNAVPAPAPEPEREPLTPDMIIVEPPEPTERDPLKGDSGSERSHDSGKPDSGSEGSLNSVPPDVKLISVVTRSETHVELEWTKVNNNNDYNYLLRDSNGAETSITGLEAETTVKHTVCLSAGTTFTLFTVFEGVKSTGFQFSVVTNSGSERSLNSVPPDVKLISVVTSSETHLKLEWTKVNNNNDYNYLLRDSNGAETSITGLEAETTVKHTVSLSAGTTFTLFTVFEGVKSTGFQFSVVTPSGSGSNVKKQLA